MSNPFFDPLEDDEDDFPLATPPVRRPNPPREEALTLLPRVMLEQALGRSGMARLKGRASFCLVIETRADDCVNPIERFLRQFGEWDKTVAKPLDQARRKDDTTGPEVLRVLSKGGRVLGVAGRFAHLPDSMVTAADIRVELPPITTEIIETVIRRMTRKRVTVPLEAARLGFGDLVACLRAGDSAAAILARLERAASSGRSVTPMGTDVPHIRDLHGYGPAKDWALELIEDIEDWRSGKIEFDAISSRNAVLTSTPGLGKSTFAKSLARSLGVPLVATSVGAWFSNGSGNLDGVIKQIDQVFATAAAAAPAVLFLDEIDAVPNRATIDSRGADWWLPVITHLLTTLDSAVSGVAEKLIVIGATNHGDKLDAALIRPGRLDRLIHIGPPDAEALAGILRQHLGQDLAGEDLADAANFAFGATGAHVVAWVRAARRTARNAGRPMQMSDLVDVIAPPDDRDASLLERIAIHEAGHAGRRSRLRPGRRGVGLDRRPWQCRGHHGHRLRRAHADPRSARTGGAAGIGRPCCGGGPPGRTRHRCRRDGRERPCTCHSHARAAPPRYRLGQGHDLPGRRRQRPYRTGDERPAGADRRGRPAPTLRPDAGDDPRKRCSRSGRRQTLCWSGAIWALRVSSSSSIASAPSGRSRPMDELLVRIMTRLVRVYDELGPESFENAANRALVTIARSVQVDAERKAGVNEPSLGEGVLPFPLATTRPPGRGDSTA